MGLSIEVREIGSNKDLTRLQNESRSYREAGAKDRTRWHPDKSSDFVVYRLLSCDARSTRLHLLS
jgi:hypothetical protein